MTDVKIVEIDGQKYSEYLLECPECFGLMQLAKDHLGVRYLCVKGREVCAGSHGAHPNGAPLGRPATRRTRKLRSEAHEMFDRLWRKDLAGNRYMTRSDAYAWLRKALDLNEYDGHISRLDSFQCRKLMDKFMEDFPQLCIEIEPI